MSPFVPYWNWFRNRIRLAHLIKSIFSKIVGFSDLSFVIQYGAKSFAIEIRMAVMVWNVPLRASLYRNWLKHCDDMGLTTSNHWLRGKVCTTHSLLMQGGEVKVSHLRKFLRFWGKGMGEFKKKVVGHHRGCTRPRSHQRKEGFWWHLGFKQCRMFPVYWR